METPSQTAPAQRTNADWLTDLRAGGGQCESALADLRLILLDGLKRGLVDWVNTAGPEFQPLAEDFAQEALLKILDNLDTFRGESMFTTWAHKIAVRVALNELRRKRWQDVSLESLLESPGGSAAGGGIFADPAPDPDLAVEQADMLARVARILQEELTEKQRAAMLATKVHGMSMTVVAERMGMQRNALYKLLHDARLRLKKRLADEGLSPANVLAVFEN